MKELIQKSLYSPQQRDIASVGGRREKKSEGGRGAAWTPEVL